MAICGSACSITVAGGQTFEGHKFEIEARGTEFDVRRFGSGAYGDWLACAKEGNVTINTYLPVPNQTPNSTAAIVCSIGTTSLSASNSRLVSINCSVDSKDVVQWSYVYKLTGDISGW